MPDRKSHIVRPRLALVGLGPWGRQYLRVAPRLGVAIVVCHTRHESDEASWLADKHPGVKHTTSLAEALADRLDGVAIVTPRGSHAGLTIECLRRGLPVLVEKPAVTTMEDVERTHAEARARGLVLRTGYTHRFDESIRRLARMSRAAKAPHWRFTWTKPAPETDVVGLIWEYYPHVFSIAELMGGVAADRMDSARFRAAQRAAGGATVELDLPMRSGTARIVVSSDTAERHKSIVLRDGTEFIAEWSDRRMRDLHRNRLLEAPEEPLACQIRDFVNAIATSSPRDRNQYALDKTVTGLLIKLHEKARRAGFR
jgi:predicted dehydrogenase